MTEENLRETFERFGRVERVKKIKDYAFVHFEERTQAVEGKLKSFDNVKPMLSNTDRQSNLAHIQTQLDWSRNYWLVNCTLGFF